MRSRISSFPNPPNAHRNGFSLLELMIVMAIGLALLGFAIPVVQSAIRNYSLTSATGNLTRMMQLARMTAIQQGSNACTVLQGRLFGMDANCDGALGNTERAYALPNGITLSAAGPAATGMNFPTTPVAVASPFAITFNSRGNTTVSPVASLIYITGWGNNKAVTVSGAGRTRSWSYDGTSWH